MAELIVEIHVPLTPVSGGRASEGVLPGEDNYPYPWIDEIEEYLAELDDSEGGEYDDGEELGTEYLFFVSGASEAALIELAKKVARLPGVPSGVYVTVNDTEGEMGAGRRLDLDL